MRRGDRELQEQLKYLRRARISNVTSISHFLPFLFNVIKYSTLEILYFLSVSP
jgi:hypothetical protein